MDTWIPLGCFFFQWETAFFSVEVINYRVKYFLYYFVTLMVWICYYQPTDRFSLDLELRFINLINDRLECRKVSCRLMMKKPGSFSSTLA